MFFASCQSGDPKDDKGNTPSDVVEQMYKAIQAKDFKTAADFSKIPDTIKMVEKKVYKEFENNAKKDDKVIITGEEWSTFVIQQMEEQSADFSLDKWEISSEEISKTDPNSAKVKTKIYVTKKGVASEADCSFPLKREKGEWKIIG